MNDNLHPLFKTILAPYMPETKTDNMTKEKLDLGKSFDDFKQTMGDHPATSRLIIGLKRAYDKATNGPSGEGYAEGFGLLVFAVKIFLSETTELNITDIDKMLTS